MKIAVIGANGQLGSDVGQAFRANGDEVTELNHDTIEITDLNTAAGILRSIRPQIIVNTAAMHNVEKCEADPRRSFAVNGEGARNLALIAREIDSVLIHISTDYVFDGSKRTPYEESDRPCPLNVYGNTKLAGEYFVLSLHARSFVLRTSALYGTKPCRAKGLNFVNLMLKLAKERDEIRVVDSEVVTPTYTADLAQQVVRISGSECYGLYHATPEGSCSWYEFAREIFRRADVRVKLTVAAPEEFPSKVRRPEYSVLENSRLKSFKLNTFGRWEEGLERYLNAL
jgi:dTDP-4-dehydrorhamnose reductase